MSQAPAINAQSYYPNPTFALEAVRVTTLLSTVFAGLTAAQGVAIAICAEVARAWPSLPRVTLLSTMRLRIQRRVWGVFWGYFLAMSFFKRRGLCRWPLESGRSCCRSLPAPTSIWPNPGHASNQLADGTRSSSRMHRSAILRSEIAELGTIASFLNLLYTPIRRDPVSPPLFVYLCK